MGLVSNIMALPASVRASEFRGESAWLNDMGDIGYETTSGISVGPNNAIGLSAVFAAVRRLAEDVSGLPLKAYRRIPGGGKQQASDDPRHATRSGRMINLYDLVHKRPNDEMGSMKFRQILIWWAVLYGNAYAEIIDNGGYAVELVPIHPHRVTPRRDDGGRMYYRVTNEGDQATNLDPGKIIHLCGISDDGMVGLMIPMLGRNSFGVYMAAERFAGKYFGAGATLKGVVLSDKPFKDQAARQEYISAFNSQFNHNKWMMLDDGATVQELGSDPEKSQLVEVLKFRIEDVARWVGIPPVKIGHNQNTPYTNVESLNQQYFLDGMKPWALRIEEECNLKLIPDGEPDLFVEHVVEALMWADAKTRAEVMNLGIRGGWRNPNEARDIHNLNPIPGGDRFRVETNLAIVDENGDPQPVGGKPEAAAPRPMGAPRDNAEAVKVAMMPTMVSVSERIIDREVKALTNKKSVSRSWIDDFYNKHRSFIVEVVSPPLMTMARLCGTDATGAAERYADEHVAESRGRIKANEDPGKWPIDRPAWMAKHLTDEVCHE